jgi:hypothetical protein
MSLFDGVVCFCLCVGYADDMKDSFLWFSDYFFLTPVYTVLYWLLFCMCTIMAVVFVMKAHKKYDEFHHAHLMKATLTLTMIIDKIKCTSVTFRKSVICQFLMYHLQHKFLMW